MAAKKDPTKAGSTNGKKKKAGIMLSIDDDIKVALAEHKSKAEQALGVKISTQAAITGLIKRQLGLL